MSAIGDELRKEIANWAVGEWRVRRVSIFGSRVKGTHRPNSDLDIAIEIEPGEDSDSTLAQWMFESERWRAELGRLIKFPIDLQWHDPAGTTPRIARALSDAEEVIYEKAINGSS